MGEAMPAPEPRAEPPPILGGRWRLRLDRPIGEGQFSRVFACEDLRLAEGADAAEHPVLRAANLVRPDAPPELLDRIPSSARLTARIDDPAIIPTLDFGLDEATGTHWFVSELCEHPTLEDWVQRVRAHDPRNALRIGRDVAAALARIRARHYAQLPTAAIHRDISPGNVYVVCDRYPDGTFGPARQVRIGDWTLARRPGWALVTEIESGQVCVGTPGFRAPEVLRFEAPTVASDIYGIGALIHFADTSLRPAEGPGPRRLEESALPGAARRYVLRMLAADARRRPASEAEVAETLESILRRMDAPAWKTALAVAAVASSVAIAAAALWQIEARPGPPSPPAPTATGPAPGLIQEELFEAERRLAALAASVDEQLGRPLPPARTPLVPPLPGESAADPAPRPAVSAAAIRDVAAAVREAMTRPAHASGALEARRSAIAAEAAAWELFADGKDEELARLHPASAALARAVERACRERRPRARDLLSASGLKLWPAAADPGDLRLREGRLVLEPGAQARELAPEDFERRVGVAYVRLAGRWGRAGPTPRFWFVLGPDPQTDWLQAAWTEPHAPGRARLSGAEAPVPPICDDAQEHVIELVGLGERAVLRIDGRVVLVGPWEGRGAAWPRVGLSALSAELTAFEDGSE
jgi:serine/threonine protein kinase